MHRSQTDPNDNWYDYTYEVDGREVDSDSASSIYRVLRGGWWSHRDYNVLRSTARGSNWLNRAYPNHGIRCARSF